MSYAPSTSSLRSLGILVLSLQLSVGSAQAQDRRSEEQPRIQGVVVMGSTFEPVRDAVVTVIGTDLETRTGRMGEFMLAGAPDGMHWVRVAVDGFPSVREQIELGGEGVVFLQFQMPTDVTALLAEMQVDVASRASDIGSGATALDLLTAKIPGLKLRNVGMLGDNNGQVRLRGFSSLTQDANPIIVIDEVVIRADQPLDVLSRIPATDVDSIQVLRGPAAAFRYPWAADGVIRVTTNKR